MKNIKPTTCFFNIEPQVYELFIYFHSLDWQYVVIVEKYNKKSLFLMLLKCHHLSHPLVESNFLLNQMNDEFFYLENFNKGCVTLWPCQLH